MLTKRIIPCFDVLDGRVVKHVSFLENRRDAGDPVELAQAYCREGADELVLLDISASSEGRLAMLRVVEQVAARVNVPLTVGGGVSTVEDVRRLLLSGADKVSMNTGAYRNHRLIEESAWRFGEQCVVVAIDARWSEPLGRYEVMLQGGKVGTGTDAVEWAKRAAQLGAGEILLTSFRQDGTKSGYDLDLTRRVADAVRVPIIASGGAGSMEHFAQVLTEGGADAALAASVFHFGEIAIPALKQYLRDRGVPVRWPL
ncbi:imidazole glycerol phosphate synthase subunit HisF [Alicyclobacillus acidocaldarius]|uniref:Imidazole glycerol phosphate synthase subunit HisF n=1 Tax=Alicyclobacillus acidocaldarius subsp. acidocaldarius (strain ATCC 27009 / DSM 446 / BCRC 14685 / JCM 5260 / KCTC 1825 / NBRC 15652 / NCIMB 11725 / NRRL B-14509 / 104-IA) TaxID=521098 RepID=C8WUY0_ALIAD|nr:imidazole glycerol phosphate synthase subunit HisF [Alicyclobacillus acidocaldarius]ACV57969.1 imidazoleglycerol phosphate synthase, cyclase subunit [Alicyclobacillus acidocaldarius subsp. acidocaldarius DSM 446]